VIVSDAGPIIIFARIGRLSLLRDVTVALTIPSAVHAEITGTSGMAGATEVADAEWIEQAAVVNRSALESLPHVLHEGEREAIALAREKGAQLLIDEIRGRQVASRLGIEVIGSLRVLSEAKKLGHLNLVRPIVIETQSNGYRFDRTLIRRFLETMDEA
jgi:predicted nucleic acid-binding protein